MKKQIPYVLSIAGYDPSGGAGVLADIKTFEALGVMGLAVTTCITYQNDHQFEGVHWLSRKKIKNQLYPLLNTYKIQYVKIGLIKNLVILSELIELLISYNKDIKIIWDPIVSASAGYNFHKKISVKHLNHILGLIEMITPNWEEIIKLTDKPDASPAAEFISKYCNLYLKGGHNIKDLGTDRIWINKKEFVLKARNATSISKHGTGCVLSAAIAGYMALNNTKLASCELAKQYTYEFLLSNSSHLGQHKINR